MSEEAIRYNETRGYTKAQTKSIQKAVGVIPDGGWNLATIEAIKAWQAARGLVADGKVGAKTYAALNASGATPVPRQPAPLPAESIFYVDGIKVFDLRATQPDPPPPVRGVSKWKKGRDGKVLKRPVEAVTGITIHQTDSNFSATRHDAAWFPDPERALAERAKGVACHLMAFEEGFVAWPNPLDWYVYHGNRLSTFELGIEIEGSYPGIASLRKPDHDFVTEKIIAAGRVAFKVAVERGREMGMPIEFVHAHRQSSPTRRDDPCDVIWQEIVMPSAKALGLKMEPARTWSSSSPKSTGSGRPIPIDWDPIHGVGRR